MNSLYIYFQKILFNLNKLLLKYEPFNIFYSKIENYKLNGYNINHIKITDNDKLKYGINNEEKYDCLVEDKCTNHSTPDIPVHHKKHNELLSLFQKDYYNYFNYDIINTKEYNPTLFLSIPYDKYIISPTVTPMSKFDLIVSLISIDNKNITSYDFYRYDYKLFNDMYNLFIMLSLINKNYIIINSLELGTQPDMYHFHICNDKLNITFSDFSCEHYDFYNYSTFDLYCIKEHKHFANMYLFKLHNKNKNIYVELFKKITKLLYNLRYRDGKIYLSQIFFLLIDNSICVIISFKSALLSYRTITNKCNFKQEYYDNLYGTFKDKYKINYHPYGQIYYYNTSTNKLTLTFDMVNEIKKSYVIIPNFVSNLNNRLNVSIPFITNDYFIRTNDIKLNVGISYNLKLLIMKYINNKIPNIIKLESLTINNFPIMYKLEPLTIRTCSKSLDNGLLDLFGDFYYFISIPIVEGLDIYQSFFNGYNDFNRKYYPTYYCTFKTKNEFILIFEYVKTTLNTFIELQKIEQRRDPNLINFFLLVGLDIINNLSISINVNDFYIINEDKEFIDYNLNNKLIITVDKNIPYVENTAFHLHHYGFNMKLKFNSYTKDNDKIKLYKKFVKSLFNLCYYHHLISDVDTISEEYTKYSFLLRLNNYLDQNTNINIENIYNFFTFAFNVIENKDNYKIIELIMKLLNNESFNFKKENILEYYHIIYKLVQANSNNIDITTTAQIPEDQQRLITEPHLKNIYKLHTLNNDVDTILISCKGDNDSFDIKSLYETKYNLHNNITYFNKLIEITRDTDIFAQGLNNAIGSYGRENLTTRYLFFKLKKNINFIDYCEDTSQNLSIIIPRLELFITDILKIESWKLHKFIKAHIPNIGLYNQDSKQKYCLQLQILINFLLSLNNEYRNIEIGGITCILTIDKIREFVIFNPKKYLDLICVVIIHNDKYIIIKNYNQYILYMNSINGNKNSIKMNSSQQFSTFIDGLYFIKQYIKKTIKKKNINFFTYPNFDTEVY